MEKPKYIINTVFGIGNTLVANSNIMAGELILEDISAAHGPPESNEFSAAICVVCLADEEQKVLQVCDSCKLKLCGECLAMGGFHDEECEKVWSKCLKIPMDLKLSSVASVRLLLGQKSDQELCKDMDQLMDHRDERSRQADEHWERSMQILEQISECLALEDEEKERLERNIGLFHVNAITNEERTGRMIFPRFSMISHSCVNNSKHVQSKTNGNKFKIKLYAQRNIAQGEEITITYTNLLRSTSDRRNHLQRRWFFKCLCQRCEDPYELNSNINSIFCPYCPEQNEEDTILKQIMESFQCTKCCKIVSEDSVNNLIGTFLARLPTGKERTRKNMEQFLEICSKVFHQNHFLCVIAKRTLTQLYTQKVDLEKKLEFCKDLYKTFSILDPGLSQSIGLTLIDLTRTEIALDLLESKNITLTSRTKLIKNCLKCEDENSFSGRKLRNFMQFIQDEESLKL